jgi:restriction system protein
VAIPDYQTIMLPLLRFAEDGNIHSSREAINYLTEYFELTEEEQKELLPSGTSRLFDNRVGWATTYIRKAELIESPRRGYFRITDRGKEVLSQNPERIDNEFLVQFPEFQEFRRLKKDKKPKQTHSLTPTTPTNPEEALATAYSEIQENLSSDILQSIQACSPEFFERLVIDVLVQMGYGGSRREAGQAVGRSGDGGIDGIIKEDKLGLDIIYIQAKRWENTVGRPEIQKFAGALQGHLQFQQGSRRLCK